MTKRVFIANSEDVPAQHAQAFRVEGTDTTLVLARTAQGFCAVNNKCPHMGLALAGGKVDADAGTIMCPFHNSKFDLCTGENLDWVTGVAGATLPKWSHKLLALGKTPTPVEAYEIIEDDGKLFVEIEEETEPE